MAKYVSASGPLRRLIGPANSNLIKYMNELQQEGIQAELDALGNNADRGALLTVQNKVLLQLTRFTRKITAQDDSHGKWLDLISKLEGDSLTEELQLYDNTSIGKGKFLEVLDEAKEAVDVLEAQKREIEIKLSAINLPTTISATNNPTARSHHAKLPPLKIDNFYGDIHEYPSFSQSVHAAIGSRDDLTDVEKMTYYMSYLKGDAANAVKGYKITGENYKIVLDVIKSRFGNTTAIKQSLISELKDLPRSAESTAALRRTSEAIERICRQLVELGEDVENQLIAVTIESKLPPSILLDLYRERGTDEPWKATDLRNRLEKLVGMREKVGFKGKEASVESKSNRRSQSSQWVNKRSQNEVSFAVVNEAANRNQVRGQASKGCVLCNGPHQFWTCSKYIKPSEKYNRAAELRLCFNCLNNGHGVRDCKRESTCKSCGKRHNTALCKQNQPTRNEKTESEASKGKNTWTWQRANQASSTKTSPSSSNAVVDIENVVNSTNTTKEVVQSAAVSKVGVTSDDNVEVLLLSTKVTVMNPKDNRKFAEILVFFDPGSQRSFITKSLADQLNLPEIEQETTLSVSTFGQGGRQFESSKCAITVRLLDGQAYTIMANTVDGITKPFRTVELSATEIAEIKNLNSDTLTIKSSFAKPSLLIGVDHFFSFIKLNEARLASGFHVVQSTVGPMLSGRGLLAIAKHQNEEVCSTVLLPEEIVERSWELETIGITDPTVENEDEEAMRLFQKHIRKVGNRYSTRLGLKVPDPDLPSNFGLALGRLKSLYRRLAEDDKKLAAYHAVITDQLNQGIIEEVPLDSQAVLVHYLPQQTVETPDKTTTKLRVVNDASAKVNKSFKSLNDVVYRGPVILPALAGMLLRFRRPKIAIISDIAKAFLQVLLEEPDRDLVRFLWLRDPKKGVTKENLVIYRYTRVVFGVNSSPFLLAATILHHLAQYDSALAREIARNIYVDNVMLSAEETETAINVCKGSKAIFGDASMDLREFASNDAKFNEYVTTIENVTSKEYTKFLGIGWYLKDDEIEITFPKISQTEAVTKRIVLSTIAGLYDPLGLVAPIAVEAKGYFQSLWSKGYEWDKPINQQDATEWKRIIASWIGVKIRIPRRFLPFSVIWDDESVRYELHCFADASALAYAAVVYLRATDSNENTTVAVVMSKNRLNPAKPISIPRMELLGVVIAVRLITFVEAELELNTRLIRKAVWTDSSAVLGQIGNDKPQPRFVQNRLTEIRKHTDLEFRHVSGKENPADFSSRGMSPQEFASKSSWWSGPPWLREPSDHWPERLDLQKVVLSSNGGEFEEDSAFEQMNPEMIQADVVVHATAQLDFARTSVFNLAKFNRLSKHLAIVAYVMRFLNKTKPERLRLATEVRECGPLTAVEYQQAELVLVKQEQAMFPVEQNTSQLTFSIDASGIWRAIGRIQNSLLSNDCIHPIYLPRESRLTTLIVMQCHERMLHAGMQQTLAEVRQRYWITKGRLTVKKILRQNCMVCRRYTAIPFRLPNMPPLPDGRVQRSRPFETVGLDYIGPTIIRVNDQKVKAWVCLITCFASRGSHLEVVMDMTAISFLNALRRFIARRGRPVEILSDNASQFTLIAKTVQLAWNAIFHDDQIVNYCARENITWRFTTERSPWKGGIYERLVGLFKSSYKRCIGRKVLNYDQLHTTVTEIEAILNSRPLTYVQDDMSNIICPKHLITSAADLGTPHFPDDEEDPPYRPPNVESREQVLDLWERSLKCGNIFWNEWVNGYLLSLRERSRFHHAGAKSQYDFSPREGEVVLLQDEQLQRGQWKLARVTDLRPSADGVIRSVEIRLPNQKTLRRPISQLYPMEVDEDQNRIRPTDKVNEQVSAATTTETIDTKTTPKLRIASKMFWVSVVLCLTLVPIVAGHKCQLNQMLRTIHSQACVSDGLVVMENQIGLKCYVHAKCKGGHLKTVNVNKVNDFKLLTESTISDLCGEYCRCPDWASGCSHYTGSRTRESVFENDRVKTLIEEQVPEEVCSWELTNNCDNKFTIGMFSMIELYDGSKHVVKSLQLVRSQMLPGDYTCLGEGETVGSPRYCEAHSCKDEGTKFCYYHRSEMVEAVSESEKVPILAWGTVKRPYYGKKPIEVPTCEQCTILCVKGGITIRMQSTVDKAEICVDQHCQHLSAPRNVENVLFPHEIAIAIQEVHVQLWKDGQRIFDTEKSCPPNPICELITCNFCMEYLANAQCAPRGVLLVWAILLYVVGIGGFCIIRSFSWIYHLVRCVLRKFCKLIKWILKSLFSITKWALTRCSTGERRQTEEINDTEAVPERQEPRRSILRYLPRRTVAKQAIAIVFIVCIQIRGADACAETAVMTASHSVCETTQDGISACTYAETTMLSIWPGGQGSCLAKRNDRNQVIGKVKISVENVKAVCNPKTEFFARDASIRVESVKRCGATGSCQEDFCANISSQAQLPEMSEKANEAPGHTFCTNSCGCWGCGCFWCYPACTFWRLYAVAKSRTIYEKYTCPTWTTRVAVKVSLQLSNDTLLHEAVLVPGQVHRWNHMKLTITSLSNPTLPILSSNFVTNQRQTVLVDNHEAESSVRCATREHAEEFKCRFSPSLCNCLPAGDTANCRCELTSLPELFDQKDRLLPLETSGVFLKVENNQPTTFIESAVVQLQLTLDQLRLTSEIDNNLCQITVKSFDGCYKCRTGAKLEYLCQTNFGSSMALLTCGKNTWMATCEIGGSSLIATLSFNEAQISEQCIVRCPGGESVFSLDGTLSYIGSDSLPDVGQTVVDRRSVAGGGWGFPKFPSLSVFTSLLWADWFSMIMIGVLVLCLVGGFLILPYMLPVIVTFLRIKRLLWTKPSVEIERKIV